MVKKTNGIQEFEEQTEEEENLQTNSISLTDYYGLNSLKQTKAKPKN